MPTSEILDAQLPFVIKKALLNPLEVECLLFDGNAENLLAVGAWVGIGTYMVVTTPGREGLFFYSELQDQGEDKRIAIARRGDYVIKVGKVFYPITESTFKAYYE